MRRPKPWFWKARKGWYIELNGKQVKLGAADAKSKTPPDEVMKEFHRLMAGEGLLTERERSQATVPTAVEAFVESKSATRPKTVSTYIYLLEPFAVHFKTRRLNSVRLNEILKFVESRKTWGDSTKHNAIVAVKGLYKWARDVGHLEINPLAGLTNPYPAGRRERGITLDEFKAMMEGTRDNAFQTVLRFLRDTGCRPGELCRLSAKHLHPEQPIATFKPREHKTGGRTGREKTVILTGTIADELRVLANTHPTGPLLRNTKGGPWKTDSIEKRVRRLRKKLGLPGHVVPYAARHAFLTRLVEMGVPLPIAAKIAGHSRTDTIQDVYLHPETKTMMEAVDKAAVRFAPTAPEKPETPAETITRLKAEIVALRASSTASGA